ncbi:hypothetical protein SLS60_001293 [Paraconiothyrium brasiliense]|uniref:Mating-type protein MAT-1 n=1 Tax=Paraconiothyrium brasiliense TaxID=300254 RepID=A0ABR3S8N7_9PLEO
MTPFSRVQVEGVTRNHSPPDLINYLTTRTGAEIVQIMQGMQDPKAQAALTAALLYAPSPVSGRATVPEKAKKALNAFVGFRCYYINIPPFKEVPMKKLSQPMGTLWDSDPNKSKWSLMTKAWSIMRDQMGKDNVPLDVFFGHACPYLNIPPPHVYLQQLGWDLDIDQHGTPTLKQGQPFTTQPLASGFADEAHSVEDIIRYCQSMGYAQDFVLGSNPTSATFLGHSNALKSRTVIMKKQTASSAQAAKRRVAERNERQAKRQVAHQTGMAAGLQILDVNAPVTEGMHGTANDGENNACAQQLAFPTITKEFNFAAGIEMFQFTWQSSQETDKQQPSADEQIYENIRNFAEKVTSMSESNTNSMQRPGGMEPGPSGSNDGGNFFDLPSEEIEEALTAFREGADTDTTLPSFNDFP